MKSILYVDDHEVLARLGCEVLRMNGYHAEFAYSAEEALARYQHGKYDLLITDYRMTGITGLELARQLRAISPQLPVLIVTGYAPEELEDGECAWLEKNHLFPALMRKVRQLLGEEESTAGDQSLSA